MFKKIIFIVFFVSIFGCSGCQGMKFKQDVNNNYELKISKDFVVKKFSLDVKDDSALMSETFSELMKKLSSQPQANKIHANREDAPLFIGNSENEPKLKIKNCTSDDEKWICLGTRNGRFWLGEIFKDTGDVKAKIIRMKNRDQFSFNKLYRIKPLLISQVNENYIIAAKDDSRIMVHYIDRDYLYQYSTSVELKEEVERKITFKELNRTRDKLYLVFNSHPKNYYKKDNVGNRSHVATLPLSKDHGTVYEFFDPNVFVHSSSTITSNSLLLSGVHYFSKGNNKHWFSDYGPQRFSLYSNQKNTSNSQLIHKRKNVFYHAGIYRKSPKKTHVWLKTIASQNQVTQLSLLEGENPRSVKLSSSGEGFFVDFVKRKNRLAYVNMVGNVIWNRVIPQLHYMSILSEDGANLLLGGKCSDSKKDYCTVSIDRGNGKLNWQAQIQRIN